MTRRQPDKAAESERETEIALFRYGLIAPLLFAAPDPGHLEATLRQIAGKTYQIPYSSRCRVSVSTLRRYLTLYQAGGVLRRCTPSHAPIRAGCGHFRQRF